MQLSEVRVEPSRRLRMWVRTSSGKAKKGVAPLDSPNLGVLHVVESVDEEGDGNGGRR